MNLQTFASFSNFHPLCAVNMCVHEDTIYIYPLNKRAICMDYLSLCVNVGVDVRLVRKGEYTLEGGYIEFVDMLIYYVFNFF